MIDKIASIYEKKFVYVESNQLLGNSFILSVAVLPKILTVLK
jgi:hypothetical protein